MKSILWGGACALVASLSSPANATDWWWVSGEPEDTAITFVDADTLASGKADAVVVDRSGAVTALSVTIDCTKPADTTVEQFACASEDERMKSYAMLGGLNPREAALALFASGNKAPVSPRRRTSLLKIADA